MSKKPTYNDYKEAKPAELMRTYKLDQKGLELAHRAILDGASKSDMAKEYDQLYRRNRRDA